MLLSPALVSPAWEGRRPPVRGAWPQPRSVGRAFRAGSAGRAALWGWGAVALPGRWAALWRPAAPAVRFAPQHPVASPERFPSKRLAASAERFAPKRPVPWTALMQSPVAARCLGRWRRRWRVSGRQRCAGGWCAWRRWRWRRWQGALAEQPRRSAWRGRIRDGSRSRQMLRVGPIGDQGAGDVGESGTVRLRRFRRHRGQVRVRLVCAGRRRSLLGDLAALQVVPPADRVD